MKTAKIKKPKMGKIPAKMPMTPKQKMKSMLPNLGKKKVKK